MGLGVWGKALHKYVSVFIAQKCFGMQIEERLMMCLKTRGTFNGKPFDPNMITEREQIHASKKKNGKVLNALKKGNLRHLKL